MRIKKQIRHSYPKTEIVIESSPEIYISDMRNRSNLSRGIEVSNIPQSSPDGKGMMDSTLFINKDRLSIDIAVFDDNQFKRSDGTPDKHCECCLYPTYADPSSWIAFLEIKDCKPSNFSNYKKYAKRQVFQSVKAFIRNDIIREEKIYGIISQPRRHTDFNDSLFIDQYETRRLKKFTGILYYGSNEIMVIDDLSIKPIKM